MASDISDPDGTDEVFQRISNSIRVYKILDSYNGRGISPKKLWKRLNEEFECTQDDVYEYLKRLRDKHLAFNENYGQWKVTNRYIARVTSLRYVDDCGTVQTCGVSELSHPKPGSGSTGEDQPASEREILDICSHLYNYQTVHGIICYLPSVPSETEIKPRKIGNHIYSLESRKLRIKSSNHPIKFKNMLKVEGVVETLLSEIGYEGKIWLNRLELNRDLEGYRMDGIQRIEFRSFGGTMFRLYNKRMEDNQLVLRSEAIKNYKRGVITFGSAVYFLNAMKNLDDAHYLNQVLAKQLKQNGGILQELHRNRIAITQAGNQVLEVANGQMEFVQTQMEDVQYSVDQLTLEQQRSMPIFHGMYSELKTQTQQQSVNNSRLGQIINQLDLTLDDNQEMIELLRRIESKQVNFQQMANDLQYKVMRELRKSRLSYQAIADFVGYSSRSGAYNWFSRKAPELKDPDKIPDKIEVGTAVYTRIHDKNDTPNDQEGRFEKFKDKVGTVVNIPDELVNYKEREFEISTSDRTVISIVHSELPADTSYIEGRYHNQIVNIIRSLESKPGQSKNSLYDSIGGNRNDTFDLISYLVGHSILLQQSDPNHKQRQLFYLSDSIKDKLVKFDKQNLEDIT